LTGRFEKCGKAFMNELEVERHKTYEHIVPVSPFEEIDEENKEGWFIPKYSITKAKESDYVKSPEQS
jgi:hypothetical protein